VITEDDLDADGAALLAPYRCVLTGTHPEYPSLRMLDAFRVSQEATDVAMPAGMEYPILQPKSGPRLIIIVARPALSRRW
jgi:N,N-dimethylformamidase beta subunit-like, C-terminal